MNLLVEVQVKDSLPVNGTWRVPSLSAVDLVPVLWNLNKRDYAVEWAEEDVFRATRDEDGIRLEFPMSADFDLLRFCITRIIDSMIRAVLDVAWANEVYKRMKQAEGSGLIVPQAQVKGPLKL